MLREKAASALAITKGARDMLSTPPAITSELSPVLMARAAIEIASRLEPHKPIDGGARNGHRQARQQQSHARDVAIVFAGLIGAAKESHHRPRSSPQTDCVEQGFDRDRSQIVGANSWKARRHSGQMECELHRK